MSIRFNKKDYIMSETMNTFQTKEEETKIIEAAFELSGFRSKSEFIRYMLFASIKEFYGDIKLND